MLLMIVCGVLVAAGIAIAVRWSRERLIPPLRPAAIARASDATSDRAGWMPRHAAGLRVYVWWATVFTAVGTLSGLVVTGAGGRLVMRLLAATSPDAKGRITEAQAIVGEISPQGTLAYLVFGALPFAFASAALYLLVEPWLPRGRLGGPVFGLLLLVGVSPFVDPLRPENVDFDVVGPGWLSVAAFAALAVLQGAFLAAVAGRLSRSLPLVSRERWAGPLAPLIAAVVLFPVGVVLAVGALIAFALPRLLPWFLELRASRRGVLVGRVLLGLAVLAALPAFVSAVFSIVQR
ncbi:hypothetical protein [Agromyces allii]|uniref:Uncharacterized protein n=1 Tax=Agromyces allii TaxID=393607 RepID=A0ABN2QF43_9MICO|nr:hypothetical protein [Agromyces allii]